MQNISRTYRFLSAFTALVMLLSISAPAILHAASLVDCDMIPAEHGEHSESGVTEADYCDYTVHHKVTCNEPCNDTDTDPAGEVCSWSFNCSCSTDDVAVQSNAIPALSKISAGFTQTVIQTINFSPETKLVSLSEQVFVSLYSPPLFLKNSSFLN